MRIVAASSALFVVLGSTAVMAQTEKLPSFPSMRMEMHGSVVADTKAAQSLSSAGLDQFGSDIPTNELSKIAQTPIAETGGTTRSAKDAELYKTISPSVVYVANKEGLGPDHWWMPRVIS